MKKERLLRALGNVKEDYIEEAAPKELLGNIQAKKQLETGKNKRTLVSFVKWGALAASLCIIAGISIKAMSQGQDDATSDSKLGDVDTCIESDYSLNYNTLGNVIMEETATNTTAADTSLQNQSQEQVQTEALKNADAQYTGDQGFPDWGLTLSVKNVTASGLTLVCTQSGGNPTGTLETGDPYWLITLVDGTWKTVEELPLPEGVDGRAWNSLAYWIPMEGAREFEINWEWIFGELPSGTYRLIKNFMDFRGTANYDTFDYWVEFEIE